MLSEFYPSLLTIPLKIIGQRESTSYAIWRETRTCTSSIPSPQQLESNRILVRWCSLILIGPVIMKLTAQLLAMSSRLEAGLLSGDLVCSQQSLYARVRRNSTASLMSPRRSYDSRASWVSCNNQGTTYGS
jgi:hypothetical protein